MIGIIYLVAYGLSVLRVYLFLSMRPETKLIRMGLKFSRYINNNRITSTILVTAQSRLERAGKRGVRGGVRPHAHPFFRIPYSDGLSLSSYQYYIPDL
jgi:hypothetical protein